MDDRTRHSSQPESQGGSPDPQPGPGRSPSQAPDLEDDAIAAMVRETVDDWTMPPQRLDSPTWRERIGDRAVKGRFRRSGRRLAGPGRTWLRRLGTAASAAIVATVALALVAVYLTLPRSTPVGPHPSTVPSVGHPTSSSVVSAPAATVPAANPLPAFALYGSPVKQRLVVETAGSLGLVDLSTGVLTTNLVQSTASYGTHLYPRPGGGFSCVCVQWDSPGGLSGTLTVEGRSIDAAGATVRRYPIATYVADADQTASQDEGQGAVASSSVSPDHRQAYVVWAYRTTPTWHIGLTVVDLIQGKIVQTVKLPDRPSIANGTVLSVWTPPIAIAVAPDGRHAMIPLLLYPVPVVNPYYLATIDGGRLTDVRALAGQPGSLGDPSCTANDEGWTSNATYYAICGTAQASFHRYDLDGKLVSQTDLGAASRLEPIPGGASIVDRAGGNLYHWDAAARTLTRIDLASGRVTGTATAAQADVQPTDPLAELGALGRSFGSWIAPTAAAKVFLDPGLAISPDGTRVYALGVTSPVSTDRGSTGVDVFDTQAMQLVDHWLPTADFTSIAVSPDGQLVFVAGAPQTDASGARTDGQTSVTAYEARGGRIRLIAGALGGDFLSLRASLAP